MVLVWFSNECEREENSDLPGYLRVANKTGRNVHRQLRFDMPTEEANKRECPTFR